MLGELHGAPEEGGGLAWGELDAGLEKKLNQPERIFDNLGSAIKQRWNKVQLIG